MSAIAAEVKMAAFGNFGGGSAPGFSFGSTPGGFPGANVPRTCHVSTWVRHKVV